METSKPHQVLAKKESVHRDSQTTPSSSPTLLSKLLAIKFRNYDNHIRLVANFALHQQNHLFITLITLITFTLTNQTWSKDRRTNWCVTEVRNNLCQRQPCNVSNSILFLSITVLMWSENGSCCSEWKGKEGRKCLTNLIWIRHWSFWEESNGWVSLADFPSSRSQCGICEALKFLNCWFFPDSAFQVLVA